MANTNCLGLYIEENLIKYAKVSKEHDKIKRYCLARIGDHP